MIKNALNDMAEGGFDFQYSSQESLEKFKCK